MLKPKVGSLTDLVLPGGGDLTSRLWAAMRSHVRSLAKWCTSRNFDTPADRHAKKVLSDFCDLVDGEVSIQVSTTAWAITEELEMLQVKCELAFLCEACYVRRSYDIPS